MIQSNEVRMSAEMDRPISGRRRLPRAALAAAVVGVALVAALLLISFSGGRSLRVSQKSVTIAETQSGVFRDFVPLFAKLAPRDVIYLDALEGGQVARVLVQPGDRVETGQPLVEFRNTALELEVLEREGRLIESITQVQSYENTLEQNRADNEKALAQIEYDIQRLNRAVARWEALAAQGYMPIARLDEAKDELALNRRLRPLQAQTNRNQDELRRQQLPRIQAELGRLTESLAITRSKLADLTVKSPVTGRVTAMGLKVGQNRNRGERLAEITLDTGFKVAAQVDEYYLARVRPGQRGVAVVGGREHALVVDRVFPQVEGGRFTVELNFREASPPGLLPGQTIQGRLELGADSPGLIVPAGPFLERTAGRWVFVLGRDGRTAERRNIRIGRRNAEQVEILSGLRPGDRVITSDYSGYEAYQRLKIVG